MNKQESIKSGISLLSLTSELAYFRKYYWGKRNEIFNELFKILIDDIDMKKELENDCENNFNDSFSDIKDFEKYNFEIFEKSNLENFDTTNINNKKLNINEQQNDEDEEESDNDNISNPFSFHFLKKSKKKIYRNYIKNYIKTNYKFVDSNFSLVLNNNIDVFLQIKKIDVLQIDYLMKIKIKNDKEEWICNSYYGLYLLYKIKKCIKPYAVYKNNKDDNIEQITIKNEEDFNNAIDFGVNEFDDLEYEINLDEIIKDIKLYSTCKLILNYSKYKNYLNIENYKIGDFKFLNSILFNYYNEQFNYIFVNENNLNPYKIIDELNSYYYKYGYRYFYLDFNYIKKNSKREDLIKYVAYWFVKVFLKKDYDKYKENFQKIEKIINFSNIPHLLEMIIKINIKNYKNTIFILLNNINDKNDYKIIDQIRNELECYINYNIILLCNIEKEYTMEKFFEIYNEKYIRIIMSTNSNNKEVNQDLEIQIKNFFSDSKDLQKFCELIKLFNFNIYINFKNDILINNINDLSFLQKYMKFINLICENKEVKKVVIKGIKFKNKKIEEEFLKYYENYTLNFIQSENNLKEVLKINDGELFEALIILDILTERIIKDKNWKNIERIKVKSLFGLTINEDFDFEKYKNKNIIFTQESMTGEIFDFGILINKDNNLNMKLYQVSKNKSKEDFLKLNLESIKIHCLNIQNQLKTLGKIKNFTFGIITSKSCFQKYLNDKSKKSEYKIMKNECKERNYELLIYDLIKREFLNENDQNEIIKYDIFSINDKNKIDLPHYNDFFKLNPRFISMKNINYNYNNCIREYINENSQNNKHLILAKIDNNINIIKSDIKDNDLALIISGESYFEEPSNVLYLVDKSKKKNKNDNFEKNENIIKPFMEKKKKDIIIFKSNNINEIYEKTPNNKINKLDNVNENLQNIHILLIKLESQKLIGKKRNGEKLFSENIIKKRKPSY